MKFVVEINMDNAAFGDDPKKKAFELAKILLKLQRQVYESRFFFHSLEDIVLVDTNGNTVGTAKVVEE